MATSKTSTSELFNRYIWLANTVYSAGKITFDEIADKWRTSYLNEDGSELPLRTFHDHRRAVEELFDIDIECDKHNGFQYYIENTDDIEKGNLREWLLSTLSVSNVLAESRTLRDRILLEEVPSGINFLTQIIDAMRDGKVLEVRHKSFWRDAEYSFLIEPYSLKLFRQRWYILGHCEDVDKIRVYALDRLTECKTTKVSFKMPKDFNSKEFFSDYYGVYVDSSVKLEKVRLRVEGVQRNYIRSLPLHHSQVEVESADNYCVFEYTIRPTVDFIGLLAEMRSYTQVLSPSWLVQKLTSQ